MTTFLTDLLSQKTKYYYKMLLENNYKREILSKTQPLLGRFLFSEMNQT